MEHHRNKPLLTLSAMRRPTAAAAATPTERREDIPNNRLDRLMGRRVPEWVCRLCQHKATRPLQAGTEWEQEHQACLRRCPWEWEWEDQNRRMVREAHRDHLRGVWA
jgi:hypothetical protein